MRTTIDAAGRLVIPRALRERAGLLGPSEVDIELDGAAIRIEAVAGDGFVEEDGILVIPATGRVITVDHVRALRESDQR
jgi:bifunctional DNA-binding transcriptional regulator/antitoxin component of YhaV-PrlF toxin-antitoxin module